VRVRVPPWAPQETDNQLIVSFFIPDIFHSPASPTGCHHRLKSVILQKKQSVNNKSLTYGYLFMQEQ